MRNGAFAESADPFDLVAERIELQTKVAQAEERVEGLRLQLEGLKEADFWMKQNPGTLADRKDAAAHVQDLENLIVSQKARSKAEAIERVALRNEILKLQGNAALLDKIRGLLSGAARSNGRALTRGILEQRPPNSPL